MRVREARGRSVGDPTWPLFGFAAVLSLVVILWMGRGLAFFFDEWDWILERRDPTVHALLDPHAGHLSVVPVAMFQMLFHTVGIDSYLPYRTMGALVHVGLVALVFVYLRSRVQPVVALCVAVVLLLLGAGWQVLLWPFAMSNALSLVGGLAALLLLDRETTASDVGAMLMLGLALGSSGVGVPVVVGVAVEVLFAHQWRRWWVVAAPSVAYVLWYVGFGRRSGAADGIVGTLRWAIEAAGADIGALTGAGHRVGQVLLVPLVVVFVWGVRRATPRRRARLAGLAVMVVGYLALVASSRSGFIGPTESRYVYVVAVLLAVTLGECANGFVFGRAAVIGVAVVATWALAWNVVALHDGRRELAVATPRTLAAVTGTYLGARTIDAADAALRPEFARDGRPFVEAFAEIGYPGFDRSEVPGLDRSVRRRLDESLIATVGVSLGGPTVPQGPAPTVVRGAASAGPDPACVHTDGPTAFGDLVVRPGSGRLRIESVSDAPVDVRVGAFGPVSSRLVGPVDQVPGGESRDLVAARTDAPRWRVTFRSAGPILVCGTDG